MFFSDKKKEALQNLERVQRRYELAGIRANEAVQSLYKAKKEAVEAIEDAEKKLIKLSDFGIVNTRKIADAKSSIRLFQEATQSEQMAIEDAKDSIKDSTDKYAKVAGAGAVAGATVATFGPTAAMAFATTFGTATTGTAISALSGAAATNAALAWLGGGAIAAGGGGMAAGTAILSMFGPIGWAIGGISIGATGLGLTLKNKKIVKQADETTEKVQRIINHIKDVTRDIDKTQSKIIEGISNLDGLLKLGPRSDDYNNIVNTIMSLCSFINKTFSVE